MPKLINILLIEDNEGDILLIKDGLEETKQPIRLSIIKDGSEGIDYLGKSGKYVNAVLPELILLDVNLPKKNGYEVLEYIKTNDKLKHIPVIMLTTSSSEKDINYAYALCANCIITKQMEVNKFMNDIAAIANFWISVVKLPTIKISLS